MCQGIHNSCWHANTCGRLCLAPERDRRSERKCGSPPITPSIIAGTNTSMFATTAIREARSGTTPTWRLVEFADLDKDGKWQYWYGEHPRGFDAPSQIQGGDCRQPGAALRRTLLYRQDEASDLDLGGVSVTLLKILRGPGPPKASRFHCQLKAGSPLGPKCLWRRRWRWGLNLVRINVCKIGASESA